MPTVDMSPPPLFQASSRCSVHTAKGRPSFKRRSAPRILAADTIFIDFVILAILDVAWIRIKICFSVAIPREPATLKITYYYEQAVIFISSYIFRWSDILDGGDMTGSNRHASLVRRFFSESASGPIFVTTTKSVGSRTSHEPIES
jgi:hypothetical protein